MTQGNNTSERPTRIVPPTYGEIALAFTGRAPLLMNAPTLLDPFAPITRELQALTKKKSSSRTADEHMNISKLGWQASLYHDEQLGPYLPGYMIKATLAKAATRWRLGTAVKHNLIIVEHKIQLDYDGPRDIEGLWDEGFRDVRAVRNAGPSGTQVPRVRPCFEDWSLHCTAAYDPQELDTDALWRIGERAGILGLADYRPEFGTFTFALEVRKQPTERKAA